MSEPTPQELALQAIQGTTPGEAQQPSLLERYVALKAELTPELADRVSELIGDAQAAEGQLIQRAWAQKLANVSRQLSADVCKRIQEAKREAWTACSNAHLDYALEGDISVLDNPYEEDA